MARSIPILFLVLLGCGICGCGVSLPEKKDVSTAKLYSFYPLPPDPPRIQLLAQFSAIGEVSEKKPKRPEKNFSWWLVGKETPEASAALNPKKAFGVAVGQGKIYVTDSKDPRVIVYDLANGRQYVLDSRGSGKLEKPVDVFVEPDGYIFVADVGRRAIIVFDEAEQYVTTFGAPSGSGAFVPASLFVYGDEIFVANVKGNEVLVLDRTTGALKRKIGKPGRELGSFNAPTSVVVSEKGNLYVTDTFNFRVQKFDIEGHRLAVFGQAGDVLGTFHRPKGITALPGGVICVLDAAFEAVQMFDEEGHILMSFGNPEELVLPARMVTDSQNLRYFSKYAHPDFLVDCLIFVTNNFGPYALTVYGFGHLKDPNKPIGVSQLKPPPVLKSDFPSSQPSASSP